MIIMNNDFDDEDSRGDLMAKLQIGRKFNSFEEVRELRTRQFEHPTVLLMP